jgi:hypothetical protein
MPEKGWAVLTVRDFTAAKIKDMARLKGMTVDELLSEMINPPSEGWTVCKVCGAKLKTANLQAHMAKAHGDSLTVKL